MAKVAKRAHRFILASLGSVFVLANVWISARLIHGAFKNMSSSSNAKTTTRSRPYTGAASALLGRQTRPVPSTADGDLTKVVHSLPAGELQRNWTYNEPISYYAKSFLSQQSDCSLPVATYYGNNRWGIGSSINLWSQALCNVWIHNPKGQRARLHTSIPDWIWMDQEKCSGAGGGAWHCYFPAAEDLCGPDNTAGMNVSSVYPPLRRRNCPILKRIGRNEQRIAEFRAGSTEFLFRQVSPLVIQEAQRQVGLLFGKRAPENLITVHIRWGDKNREMRVVPIAEYIEAVEKLLFLQQLEDADKNLNKSVLQNRSKEQAHIYLATEDPLAAQAFESSAPEHWKIYYDRTLDELGKFRPLGQENHASVTANITRGRAGLMALGSLLVAMEASYFVLTTESNWSRIMNHLRTNIIDPRCGNCTRMIDLQYGWL